MGTGRQRGGSAVPEGGEYSEQRRRVEVMLEELKHVDTSTACSRLRMCAVARLGKVEDEDD